jgi:hypothetical protein
MRRALLGVVLLAAISCGGSKDGPTSPGQQPFSQTVSGTVSVFGTVQHPLSIARAGTMTLRLQWTGTIDLDLHLSPTSCTALYPTAACGLLASANGTVNPEVITRSVTANEQFKIWVDNLSLTQSANYTIQVTIQ